MLFLCNKYNMKKIEYEKGYEDGYRDGAKDCQKLYSKILDYVCSMFQEKEKEYKERMDRCKERRKTIERTMSGRQVIRNMPIDTNLKIGDVVFFKYNGVMTIGIIKNTLPLKISLRNATHNPYGVPTEISGVHYCNCYYSGVNISLDEWKKVSLDASVKKVCKRLGISYRRE